MPMVLTDSANYAAIANAIRRKNGESSTYKPREMAAAIDAIVIYEGRCPRSEPETVYSNAVSALSWEITATITLQA